MSDDIRKVNIVKRLKQLFNFILYNFVHFEINPLKQKQLVTPTDRRASDNGKSKHVRRLDILDLSQSNETKGQETMKYSYRNCYFSLER